MILLLELGDKFEVISVINKFNSIDDILTQIVHVDKNLAFNLRVNGYMFNYTGKHSDNILLNLDHNHINKPYSYTQTFNSYRKFKIKNILV
jgi:hypothetical protein